MFATRFGYLDGGAQVRRGTLETPSRTVDAMASTSGYSLTPMSRLQFLMLVAVEHGATVDQATDWALHWGNRHPQEALFEYRTYPQWRRAIGTAGWKEPQLASTQAAP